MGDTSTKISDQILKNIKNPTKLFNNIKEKIKSNDINKILNEAKNKQIKLFSIIVIILLLLSTFYYIYYKLTLNNRNCKVLNNIYDSVPKLNSITSNNNYNNYALRDFYIKSAYNCCSAGNFKNDFVNLCALKTCINQGVRFLDFEIYSINDQPVIATSSVNDFNIKQTYNYIPINDAFELILSNAFSGGTCPNYEDPIILHFRIMSNNCKMFNNFADIIVNNTRFNSRTLGKKYSYEFKDPNIGSKNLGKIPIKNFKSKIIISIDSSNPLYQHTKLDEYINIASGSAFMHLLRFKEVKYTQDLNITNFNKKNMSVVLPDVQTNNLNPNFNIAKTYGCQFIAMSFQNYDINLQYYNEFFDSNRSAFVLKPKKLRFIPVTIPVPSPQDPKLSYESRNIKSNYYNYKI